MALYALRVLLRQRALWPLLLILSAAPAGAQVDESDRKTARALGEEATALFAQGDYKAALKKYEVAYKLVPVTTLGVRVARTLDKLGRLVEAEARYVEVLAMELPQGAPAVHVEAKEQAKKELDALRPRIPSLIVDPDVPATEDVRVTLDGAALRPDEWRKRKAVDPGVHRVLITRAGFEVGKDVKVIEGDIAHVPLSLPKTVPPPPASSASASAEPPKPPPPASTPKPASTPVADAGPRRAIGFAALGVGAVGFAVGLYGYLGAAAKQGTLDQKCKAGDCPPSAWGDLDTYESKKRLATVGTVVGLVGAAAGGVLLFTDVGKTRRTTGFVGPGTVGVRGTFR